MRRTDREVLEWERILEIVHSCDCCRLGFRDGEGVYIVPLNFGMTERDGRLVLYFHSAPEGKKLEFIRTQPQVGFELDTGHRLVENTSPCSCSFRYQSVIGRGQIALVEDRDEKLAGLRLLMEHYSGRGDWSFPPQMVERVEVFRLVVTQLSCKEH